MAREPQYEQALTALFGTTAIAEYRTAGAPYGWCVGGVVQWISEQPVERVVRIMREQAANVEPDPRRRHTQRPEQRPQ